MPSLGAVANLYNEIFALPSWIENVLSWADDVVVYHAGPGGEYSNDGTIELLEKHGIRIVYGSIDEGFGVVRSKMVRLPSTDWTVIMDADERILKYAGRMVCTGTDSYDVGKHYPELADVNLSVQVNGVYDQIAALKSLMRPEYDAIVTSRRHWQDLSYTRPSQSWHLIADWQARILRNCEHVGYDPRKAMHEALVDFRTYNPVTEKYQCPKWYQPHESNVECFHDHFHLYFKRLEREQRSHDVEIYNRIHAGEKPPTLAEFRASRDGINLEPTGDVA